MAGPTAAAAIRRTRLDSGARVVTEAMPGLRSVAVGFWVGTGSRDEPDALAGASHFLEHLLFKGTDGRSVVEIAEAVESVGGDINAFTTQELTAFYVRVPDECLPLAIEILSDIVWRPALREADVDAERQVILEEIRMRDDAPEDLVHDVFVGAMFPGHPIGREVIGAPETINAMRSADIGAFHQRHYHPSNVVVAVAGNLEHDDVVALVEKGLEGASGERPPRDPYVGAEPPRPLAVLERPTEQAHVVLGMRSLSRDDPDRYALTVLNQTLGGGMSSRLFQEVREQRGLAYSVYSFRAAYEETGAFAVSAGTGPDRLPELLRVIDAELARVVAEGGITEHELDAAKGHLRGSLALSLESSASRMHRLGRSELTMGEIPSLDELVAEVDAVGTADVARVVERVLVTEERTLAVVGPVQEAQFSGHVRPHRPVPSSGDPSPAVIRVGVFGAGGRMGSTVCAAVANDPDLELVAAVDPYHEGIDLQQLGVPGTGLQVARSAEALAERGADVAVDFTVIDAARENLGWCADHGVHAVVGTTGFSEAELDELRLRLLEGAANAVIVPNFAIGAVLMMRFAELASPYFETAEVIELHHDEKVDAPSGTAMLTAQRMAQASADWGKDPTEKIVIEGARGAEGPGGIRVHSVRLRGLVAHQEVVLGTAGQSLSIRHDSYDRTSFMPGVLLAIRAVRERPGLTVGLDALLGL